MRPFLQRERLMTLIQTTSSASSETRFGPGKASRARQLSALSKCRSRGPTRFETAFLLSCFDLGNRGVNARS